MDKAFAIRRAIYAIQARGGEWGMPISRMGSGESGGKTQAAESAHPEAISKRPDARRLAVHPEKAGYFVLFNEVTCDRMVDWDTVF